jgi:hypothetical protein
MQFPLDEANGDGIRNSKHLGALIGAFVPKYRVDGKGFKPLDGTKNVASLGIKPELLRLIGDGFTFHVGEAGTVFLGINDTIASDNSGGSRSRFRRLNLDTGGSPFNLPVIENGRLRGASDLAL